MKLLVSGFFLVFGLALRAQGPFNSNWVTVTLHPGLVADYLSIKQTRQVVGRVVNGGTAIRLRVNGCSVDHVDIPLGNKATIVTGPWNATVTLDSPHVINSNLTLKAGSRIPILETIIEVQPNGQAEFQGVTIVESDGTPTTTPSLNRIPGKGQWKTNIPYASMKASKAPSLRLIQETDLGCRAPSLTAFENVADDELNFKPNPQSKLAISYSEKTWEEWLESMTKELGKPINNCDGRGKNQIRTGGTLLNFEKELVKKFPSLLAKNGVPKNIPAAQSAEKFAAVDVCSRTCMGELGGQDNCVKEGTALENVHLKAVVGTLFHRALELQNDDASLEATIKTKVDYSNRYELASTGHKHPSATYGYRPRGDAAFYRGGAMELLKEPMLEVASNGRQYNNWYGDGYPNQKSLCPLLKKNPDYSAQAKRKNPALKEFIEDTPKQSAAFKACARFCAEAVYRPSNFKTKHLCGFNKLYFTSDLPGCVWKEKLKELIKKGCLTGEYCSKSIKNRKYCDDHKENLCPMECATLEPCSKYPDSGATVQVPICNDKGKIVDAYAPACTRFWRTPKDQTGKPRRDLCGER